MANGENTKLVTDFLTGAIGNAFGGQISSIQQTATDALIIDQIERLVMVVVIVGSFWYFSRKK